MIQISASLYSTGTHNPMADGDSTDWVSCLVVSVEPVGLRTVVESPFQKLGYCNPTKEQQRVIETFVCGKHVFVCLPGNGESLC